MLIRRADVLTARGVCRGDVRVSGGLITEVAETLTPISGEEMVDAGGGFLMPGLHDHHIHLTAFAAALRSVDCLGQRAGGLTEVLRAARRGSPGVGDWVRVINYHEAIDGDIDRDWLDVRLPDVPVRVQHRSGQLWVFNSMALRRLGAELDAPAGLERIDGRATGRLYREDAWLRQRMAEAPPGLAEVGRRLAQAGITGVTDATVLNTAADAARLLAARADGALPQRLLVMGDASVGECNAAGPLKCYLDENALPDIDAFVAVIEDAHAAGRAVAVHCVTEAELTFTLAALEAAGTMGDRIEHAAVTPDALLPWMARLGVRVVMQPHFVAERGEAYRCEVPAHSHGFLYRGKGFMAAGVPLAAGSDAPYGSATPWHAMDAAMQRRTASGYRLGADEALRAEQALDLFLAPLEDVGKPARRIAAGMPADLVLMDRPWHEIRVDPAGALVRRTIIDGCVVYDA